MSAAAFVAFSRQYEKDKPAGPGDGIPPTMCRRCGFNHAPGLDCISVLRDRIAVLEFKAKMNGGRPRKHV